MRTVDQDGHLHVASSVISAEQVNSYLGAELPDWQSLGLQPDREYRILRPGAELAKAAASFSNKPLMIEHRPQSAADHDRDLVVGSVANPVWKAPELYAELVIWDQAAIDAIMDGSRAALSCGYHFEVSMVPGTFNGQRFDGQMNSLSGNHVSLVPVPRVAGAVVGDAAPNRFKGKSTMSETTTTGEDDYSELLEFLSDKLQSGDLEQVKLLLGCGDPDLMAGDDPPPFSGRPRPGGEMDPITRNAVAQDAINRARKKQADDFYARHPGAARLRNAR
jgi:hypothetical protein